MYYSIFDETEKYVNTIMFTSTEIILKSFRVAQLYNTTLHQVFKLQHSCGGWLTSMVLKIPENSPTVTQGSQDSMR